MNKNVVFSLLFIFCAIITGCMQRNPSDVAYIGFAEESTSTGPISADLPLNYKNLKKFILEPKCMSCHSGVDAKPENDPIDFTSFETAMVKRFVPLLIEGKPEISRLFISVDRGEMPPRGKLHEQDLDYIKRWIEACAPKETPSSIPAKCIVEEEDDDNDDDWDDEEETPSTDLQVIRNISDAVTSSIESFKKMMDIQVQKNFKNIEAIVKDGGVGVTISADKNYLFSCHRHDSNDPYECHRVQ